MRIAPATLRVLSVIYISFALVPFFLGWLRWYYGLPLLFLYIYSVYAYGCTLNFSKKETISKSTLIIGLLLIVAWVGMSGAGGMGYQVSDLSKSNTLIKELVQKPWPLSYEVGGEAMYLSHYLGYYLPGPAVVGFLGYKYVQLFLFFYTLTGLVLGFYFLSRLLKKQKALFVFFLIFFGGVTTFSFLFQFGSGAIQEYLSRVYEHGYVFWLNSWEVIPLNYMSFTDMLYWTPQHTIPTVLGVGILLNDGFVDKDISFTPFVIVLFAIWSPLVMVGLLPFFLFVLLHHRLHGILNFHNFIIAPILFGIVAIFLSAIDSQELVQNFIFTDLSERAYSLWDQLGVYMYFLFFEVYIWAIPILWVLWRVLERSERVLLVYTLVLLSLIPLYRFGLWNDWCARVSMPALIVLALFAFKALQQSRGLIKGLLVIVFLMGTHAATIGIFGSYFKLGKKIGFYPPPEHKVQTLPQICVGYPITQFVADKDTFFFTYLAKKP